MNNIIAQMFRRPLRRGKLGHQSKKRNSIPPEGQHIEGRRR